MARKNNKGREQMWRHEPEKSNKNKAMKNCIPFEIRGVVHERSNGVCEYCGRARGNSIHHIVHRSQGGGNSLSNLINLCINCHHKAHTEPETIRKFKEAGNYDNIRLQEELWEQEG